MTTLEREIRELRRARVALEVRIAAFERFAPRFLAGLGLLVSLYAVVLSYTAGHIHGQLGAMRSEMRAAVQHLEP